ncbi:hypothetical protein EV580_1290 [Mycobacterium sp. BK086]|uniref:DUF7620 family protein n=1 Tax=Mycobacterium sp. BK086 TaxID=2512165 RepID=UPI00105DEE3F|nr:hypothetical protein [Mycobacterium sp. BK086]TDO18109.1 hypothetical protein EV580_1290 [Mycobacterium sp. BK086]
MWFWNRARGDIADARQRATDAELRTVEAQQKNADADRRLLAAAVMDIESRRSTAGLRRQLERNGFTEMLQESWGKRGHA